MKMVDGKVRFLYWVETVQEKIGRPATLTLKSNQLVINVKNLWLFKPSNCMYSFSLVQTFTTPQLPLPYLSSPQPPHPHPPSVPFRINTSLSISIFDHHHYHQLPIPKRKNLKEKENIILLWLQQSSIYYQLK